MILDQEEGSGGSMGWCGSSDWAAQFGFSTSCQEGPSALLPLGSFRGLYHVIAEGDVSGSSQTFFNVFGQRSEGGQLKEHRHVWENKPSQVPPSISQLPCLYQGGVGLQGVWENPSDLAVSSGPTG